MGHKEKKSLKQQGTASKPSNAGVAAASNQQAVQKLKVRILLWIPLALVAINILALAFVLMDQKRNDEAIAHLSEALRLKPDDAEPRSALSTVLSIKDAYSR